MGGGTCAGAVDGPGAPPGCCTALVVCSRLMICIILACVASEDACCASSSAVAEACTARLSESKKRLAGSRLLLPATLGIGCVTSSWRARTTSACSASSSSAEMKEADWNTVAMGEQMLPAASGGDLKKTSEEKSCLYTESLLVAKMRYCRRYEVSPT